MINGFIGFDKIRSQAELDQLAKLAKQDQHGVIAPTMLLKKDGEVVGYFSVGTPGVPFVFAWLSTKDIKPRESFHLINAVESMVSGLGASAVAFPVPKSSPFYDVMESIGFRNAGEYTVYIKEF